MNFEDADMPPPSVRRSWLEAIPPIIERDSPHRTRSSRTTSSSSRTTQEYVNWPAWKRAQHFDQCYRVILLARERNKRGIEYIYREWISERLGSPYEQMLAWAEENGWPSVEMVWKFGWR